MPALFKLSPGPLIFVLFSTVFVWNRSSPPLISRVCAPGYLPATPISFIFVRGQNSSQQYFYVEEVSLPLPAWPTFCREVRLPLFQKVRPTGIEPTTNFCDGRLPIRLPASQR